MLNGVFMVDRAYFIRRGAALLAACGVSIRASIV